MFTIKFSRRAFKDLKFLKKKFRKIEDDFEKLFLLLSAGELLGDQIKNFKGFEVFKARVKNSSGARGNSGGFRVIYYLKRKNNEIFVLTIYSKTQKSDVMPKEILEILKAEII